MVTERQRALSVLKRALANELGIQDFHSAWPRSEDPLLEAIGDETEDTIEHAPASLIRGQADLFERSAPYKLLIADSQLLADDFARIPSDELLDIRTRLLREIDLYQDDDALAAAAHNFIEGEITKHQRPGG
jgi:hypothetical protein